MPRPRLDDLAVRNVESVFGGVELSVRLDSPFPPSFIERSRARGLVKGCRACDLRATCSAPVAGDGPLPASYVVLGDSPHVEEDRVGRPFVGKLGGLLRAQLDIAGLDVGAGFFTYTAACAPEGEIGHEHQAACRENMFRQLDASGAQVVLLVGAAPIRAWRMGMKVDRVAGNVYVWQDRYIVVPCIHPGAVAKKIDGAKMSLERSLKVLSAIVNRESPALSFMDDFCIRCDADLAHIDTDGVGYCHEHWEAGGKHDREVTEQRWADYAGTQRLI